jgi:hypothetical protein
VFGAKSSTVRMGNGAGLLDDDDDDNVQQAPPTSQFAAAPNADDVPEFDMAAHEAALYEEEQARIAAQYGGSGGDDLVLGEGLSTSPTSHTCNPGFEAHAVPPPAASPAPKKQTAKPTVTKPLSTAQTTLTAFATANAATTSFQKSYTRRVDEQTTKVNGEYVMQDVVTYVHNVTGNVLTEADYKQQLSAVVATNAPERLKSHSPSVVAVEPGEKPGRTALQPRNDSNVKAGSKATVAPPAGTAGKKTATKPPPAGVKSLASFWNNKA